MDNSIGNNNNFYRNFYSNDYNRQDISNTSNKVEKESNNLSNKVNMKDKVENGECKTCKERKYKDGSDDPSVSFQTPTHISPESSAAAVSSHEMEHVVNEKSYAENEGREIVAQSVSLESAVCPECGKTYVAGGETRTTTRQKPKSSEDDFFINAHKKFLQGYFGNKIDTRV